MSSIIETEEKLNFILPGFIYINLKINWFYMCNTNYSNGYNILRTKEV